MGLKGRKVGLKASMNEAEMRQHLLEVLKDWASEGFSEEVVKEAIFTKCKPLGLTSNFYWSRYPEAAATLRKVWRELNWNVSESISDSFKILGNALRSRPKKQKIKFEKKTVSNFLEQF